MDAKAEWLRESKLLKISKGEDISLIADVKGGWKVHSEEGKKDIKAYLKGKELYLPLKEICQLLDLKLDWDEETFIGRVSTK